MADGRPHRVPASRLIRESVTIRVKVTGLGFAKWRIRAAGVVFRFGAWVAGCPVEISDSSEE